MSEIENALKSGEPEDFFITDEDRIMLIEILSSTASVLQRGNLYFNGKGEHNQDYAKFCMKIAKKFANMPVHKEH